VRLDGDEMTADADDGDAGHFSRTYITLYRSADKVSGRRPTGSRLRAKLTPWGSTIEGRCGSPGESWPNEKRVASSTRGPASCINRASTKVTDGASIDS
jgi:hypothetical protein